MSSQNRVLGVLFCVGTLFCPSAWADYRVSAKGVLFSNSTRAVRYYGKKVHTKVAPASTVKVMTALLALEHLPINKIVVVSKRAADALPSKMDARAGERYRVADLVRAVLLKSANDAAVVLAEAVAGSEEAFVRMMNARAARLGAKRTRFCNANGLPSHKRQQYTTPYDMYLIFREALKEPFFRKTIQRPYATICSTGGRRIAFRNHNRILFRPWKRKVYGKTGWTVRARQCFVGYIVRKRDICIISLFGATRRWEDIRHIISRYGGIAL